MKSTTQRSRRVPKKEQFSIRLPVSDRRKIDRLAKREGRTRAGYVQKLVTCHLAEQDRAAA